MTNVPDQEIHFGGVPLGSATPGSSAELLQSDRAKEMLAQQRYLH